MTNPDPTLRRPLGRLALEWRFWPNVLPVESGCWEWQAATCNEMGYGAVEAREYRERKAHRVAYAMLVGNPKGWHVLHRCDNPRCVNPGHLFLGTYLDNNRDRKSKGRGNNQYMGLTHCKHGHEFTPENTYHAPSRPRARRCRKCREKAAWRTK